MTVFGLRIFLFTVLLLLFAGVQILLDKSTNSRDRRLEVVLIYLFVLWVVVIALAALLSRLIDPDHEPGATNIEDLK